jgi:hypothetical protein
LYIHYYFNTLIQALEKGNSTRLLAGIDPAGLRPAMKLREESAVLNGIAHWPGAFARHRQVLARSYQTETVSPIPIPPVPGRAIPAGPEHTVPLLFIDLCAGDGFVTAFLQ